MLDTCLELFEPRWTNWGILGKEKCLKETERLAPLFHCKSQKAVVALSVLFSVVNGSKMALWVAKVAGDHCSIARIAFSFDAAVNHTGFISRPSLPSLNNAVFSAKSGSALVSYTRPSIFPPSHSITEPLDELLSWVSSVLLHCVN